MGVFDDKKFEQLDWMTQMTETIESDLNELLARLPEQVTLDVDQIYSLVSGPSRSMYLNVGSVVRDLRKRYAQDIQLSWKDESKINDCFEFRVSEGAVLDFTKRELQGTITLVKLVQTFEDEELQKDMGKHGIEAISSYYGNQDGCMPRMNEILELLGECDQELKHRSARKKIRAIKLRLEKIFLTNEWRIRSTVLADKVGFWIASYIKDGNLAGFTNFCKLKVMTHNNMPIYSIQEEQI